MRLDVPLLPALLAACAAGGDAPTFHDDVAPVLDARCMQCHQQGGIAPMAFDTYEATAAWGRAIAVSTAHRTMPPQQVVGDGSCGDFVDDAGWLSDEELDVLQRWVDGGLLEGEPRPRPAPPSPARLVDPDVTLTTPTFTPVALGTPDARFDEYRCFRLEDPTLAEGGFLTGFEVEPGNAAIVHHVIGMFVDPAAPSGVAGLSNGEQMEANAAASPERAGWPCFAEAGAGVDIVSDPVTWAPGTPAVELPAGLGVRIPAGAVFVAQVHYNLVDPANVGATDSTRIGLRIAREVERELYPAYLAYLLFDGRPLEPGREEVTFKDAYRVDDILGFPLELDLWAVLPHMHERGRRMRSTLLHEDGSRTCMLEIEDWDFNWQFAYFYEEPVRIRGTDAWQISCTYDTSDATEPVLPGWGTKNEMCLNTLWVTVAR